MVWWAGVSNPSCRIQLSFLSVWTVSSHPFREHFLLDCFGFCYQVTWILLQREWCPPDSYAEAWIPSVTVNGGRNFVEGIELNEVVRVEPQSDRNGVLLRRQDSVALSLQLVRQRKAVRGHGKKAAVYKATSELSPGAKPASTLI